MKIDYGRGACGLRSGFPMMSSFKHHGAPRPVHHQTTPGVSRRTYIAEETRIGTEAKTPLHHVHSTRQKTLIRRWQLTLGSSKKGHLKGHLTCPMNMCKLTKATIHLYKKEGFIFRSVGVRRLLGHNYCSKLTQNLGLDLTTSPI